MAHPQTALSVCIIAKDECRDLPDCLASVGPIASDIVVIIDDTTTDSTQAVAEAAGARVFIRKFTDFADQKNYCLDQAANDWVLFLDADERISPELANQISKLDLNSHSPATAFVAFVIPRVNFIFGMAMSHSNWDPATDAHIWLFRKSRGRWHNQVHEQVRVSGPVGRLTGPKIHHNYRSVTEYFTKLNFYTTLEAKKKNWSPLLLIIYPPWKFIRHYFVFRGFLDGWHGLFLSYLQAIYGLVVVVKTWPHAKNASSS